MFYALPRAFITLSEFQRELLRSRVDVPVHVLPMVVTVDAVAAPRAESRGATLEIGVVGAVAFSTKGQDCLPRVARELRGSGRRVHIHVVGDGPDLPLFRAMVESSVPVI